MNNHSLNHMPSFIIEEEAFDFFKVFSIVYVIRNSRIEPVWETVEPKIVSISGNTVDTLIRTQGIGDLYRIYLGAQRDGMDYNLAFIPYYSKTVDITDYQNRRLANVKKLYY